MMKRFKHLYIAFLALLAISCVDDYFEANPPQRLDAPYAYVQSSVAEKKDGIPLAGGEQVTFTIDIVDAPGTLKTVDYTFSKGGEVVSENFDQLVGKSAGSFEVTVKAPMNLDGTSSFTIAISDAQDNPKVLTITKVLDVSYLHEGPDFTVEIIDADGYAMEGDELDVVITIDEIPAGTIGAISLAGSAGSVAFDEAELNALIGASSGTITGTLTVGPVASTGMYDVTVAITDAEQNRQVVASDEILFVCPAADDISGTYLAITNGTNAEAEEGAENFFGLEETVTITQVNEGQFEVSDLSFGLYLAQSPEYGTLEGLINVCGSDIVGDATVGDGYSATGTLNTQVDGVIMIEWSNQYGDSGTTILKKQ